MGKRTNRWHWPVLLGAAAFLGGLGPAAFNLVVDPYELHAEGEVPPAWAEIAEKAHYPLWKMTHFPRDTADLVVLGDSRARALRDKYWHEQGETHAYNFAYGGANVPEIAATFDYVSAAPAVRTLVVGVQLRSFDLDHKAGLNRVPEAIEMIDKPWRYYTSWFVSKVGWRIVEALSDKSLKSVAAWQMPGLISSARAEAAAPLSFDAWPLSRLVDPATCGTCIPTGLPPLSGAATEPGGEAEHISLVDGPWAKFWPPIEPTRELPQRFERQVRKNGRNDWKTFQFAESLWLVMEKIAAWSKDNQVKLVFFIPPTISEMQARMREFGFADLDRDFRLRLAQLAPVIDFDFDHPLNRDLNRFSDAYHFDAGVAREIVGELTRFVRSEYGEPAGRSGGELQCPISHSETALRGQAGGISMLEGVGCRIWRTDHDL